MAEPDVIRKNRVSDRNISRCHAKLFKIRACILCNTNYLLCMEVESKVLSIR